MRAAFLCISDEIVGGLTTDTNSGFITGELRDVGVEPIGGFAVRDEEDEIMRFGDHEELANLAAFLVSDGAPFINGECVTIDGGEWIASGGEFNGLTRIPRDGVKAALRAMRGK